MEKSNALGVHAVKYSFPTGMGQLAIGFVMDGKDALLTVADNGMNTSATTNQSISGLDSRFIEAFVRQRGYLDA